MNSMCRTSRLGAACSYNVAVLASAGVVRAIFCKYGNKNGQNLRFWCRTCGKCSSQSICLQVRHQLKLSKVHVALLGEGFVEGKGFVEGVTGLAFLGNLEVVPHELLVVGVHTVLDDALGALGG